MIYLALLLVAIMLIAAIATLILPGRVSAIAAVSVVSLALSVLFVLLQAPDVALTEAVVGSGLSTIILALALRRINRLLQHSGAEDA
jgi:energy-converting hydrogenase B subunit D